MAPVTGTYTFTTPSDDGVRLYVNGQLLIDNWTDHAVGPEQRHDRARRRPEVRHPDGLLRPRTAGDDQTVLGVSGQTTQVVPQWVLYPAPAGQSTTDRQCGPRPDDYSAAGASLNGIARDDGLPGQTLTITWSKISGREDSAGGTVTFKQSERAGHDGNLRRRRHLRAAPHRERRRGDRQRRRDDHGQPRAIQPRTGSERGGRHERHPTLDRLRSRGRRQTTDCPLRRHTCPVPGRKSAVPEA